MKTRRRKLWSICAQLVQSTLKRPVVYKLHMGVINLVPRREVWERANQSLSVTSQLRVEFRIDLSENGKGIGWGIMYVGQKFTTRSASASFGPKISIFEYCGNATKLALNFHSQFLAVPDQLSVLVL